MILTLENGYEIGEIVYLRTDRDQRKRVITGITLRPNNTIIYLIALGSNSETEHYEFEISEEENKQLKMDS